MFWSVRWGKRLDHWGFWSHENFFFSIPHRKDKLVKNIFTGFFFFSFSLLLDHQIPAIWTSFPFPLYALRREMRWWGGVLSFSILIAIFRRALCPRPQWCLESPSPDLFGSISWDGKSPRGSREIWWHLLTGFSANPSFWPTFLATANPSQYPPPKHTHFFRSTCSL